jgi:hypothetical protein
MAPLAAPAMQIRRVSRYLIWSWQYLRTERFAPGENVGEVLADKRFVELAGPEIRARDNRIWYLPERDIRIHRRSRSTITIACIASARVLPRRTSKS